MRKYISRGLQADLKACLEESPIVALIGPRQCGKSTLAKMVRTDYPASVYLDLENPQASSQYQSLRHYILQG
ncbi:MAG: AAA family ATPase [Victivallales bacterium]|nr:AAA family ATPase [Victivallales bacterium]